jgi:hypothetical protein
MPFQVIEQLAAPAGHLEQSPAGVKILAMRAQVLGQVIDTRCEQCNLHLAGTSIGLVGFVFGYDFGFYDSRHGEMVELHDCRRPLQAPCHPPVPLGGEQSR